MDSLAIHTNFGTLDWAIIIAFLVISTALGLWARRYIGGMEDYVVAGRAVKTYLGVATIIASEMGLSPSCTPPRRGSPVDSPHSISRWWRQSWR